MGHDVLRPTRASARGNESTHRTFGWNRPVARAAEPFIAPFIAHGFVHFALRIPTAQRTTPLAAPHVDRSATVRKLTGSDWCALQALLVDTREIDRHAIDEYAPFVARRIAAWRR